jgi:hypothetical protein
VEHDEIAAFRLPGSWKVASIVITLLPCLSFILRQDPPRLSVLPFLAAIALFLATTFRYCTVQLRAGGIKLNSLWWLPWGDVREVAYRSLFGLPYFYVKRRRGFSWWIPLYYVGDNDLGHSIIRAAPSDNPFRSVLMPP